MIISNNNTRGRGKLKLILVAVVKKDMIELNLNEYLALSVKGFMWLTLIDYVGITRFRNLVSYNRSC